MVSESGSAAAEEAARGVPEAMGEVGDDDDADDDEDHHGVARRRILNCGTNATPTPTVLYNTVKERDP